MSLQQVFPQRAFLLAVLQQVEIPLVEILLEVPLQQVFLQVVLQQEELVVTLRQRLLGGLGRI